MYRSGWLRAGKKRPRSSGVGADRGREDWSCWGSTTSLPKGGGGRDVPGTCLRGLSRRGQSSGADNSRGRFGEFPHSLRDTQPMRGADRSGKPDMNQQPRNWSRCVTPMGWSAATGQCSVGTARVGDNPPRRFGTRSSPVGAECVALSRRHTCGGTYPLGRRYP